jgi:PKD repeat protein
MLAALNSAVAGRNNLWSNSNLIATGTNDGYSAAACVPNADFTTFSQFICPNSSAAFTDLSTNATPTSWNWTFAGGTPSTSTIQNPTSILYSAPGTYDVTLVSTTNSGSDTIVKKGYMTVAEPISSTNTPYTDGFETGTFTNNGWKVITVGGVLAWAQTNTAAATGTNSIKIDNNTTQPNGIVNSLVSKPINFSGLTKAYVIFKYAYAQRNTSSADVLKVYTSINCGKSWSQKFIDQGAGATSGPVTLATVSNRTSAFTPQNQSDWKTKTIDISSVVGIQNAMVKFEFTGNGGNNVYLDDINISSTSSGISKAELADNLSLNVIPNPSNGHAELTFNLLKTDNVNAEIMDIVGRTVRSLVKEQAFDEGEHRVSIDNINAGVYFIKLTVGSQQFIQKMIINQ